MNQQEINSFVRSRDFHAYAKVINRKEWERTLLTWFQNYKWDFLVTFTNNRNYDHFWYMKQLESVKHVVEKKFGCTFTYCASIEQTKSGRNHCHALVSIDCPTIGFDQKQLRTTAGSVVFKKDWHQRVSTPKMAEFIKRNTLNEKDYNLTKKLEIGDQLVLNALRKSTMTVQTFIGFYYSCKTGCIADVAPVRSQKSVTQYALKYAFKSRRDQSTKCFGCWDWLVSSELPATMHTS